MSTGTSGARAMSEEKQIPYGRIDGFGVGIKKMSAHVGIFLLNEPAQ